MPSFTRDPTSARAVRVEAHAEARALEPEPWGLTNQVTGAPVDADKNEDLNGASELTAGLGRKSVGSGLALI